MPKSEKRTAVAKHAAAVRWNKPNQDETARNLAVERIADYVQRVVAAAPPLDQQQLDRLATLLRGGTG